MRLSNIIITLILLAIVAPSCIEAFRPDTLEYEEILLIEGLITDNPDVPHRISLTRTLPLSGKPTENAYLLSGAIVSVECDDGTIYPFAEAVQDPGTYFEVADALELELGKYYKMVVETVDGKIYESDLEPYIQPTPMESITYRHEISKTVETEEGDDGLQFYANSTSIDGEPIYLRWLLDATYTYTTPFEAAYIWDGSNRQPFNNDSVRVCWKSYSIRGVFIGDSYGLAETRVANAPLNFVSQYGNNLSVKYSLNAYQLSISENSYKFWYELDKVVNETGGLYQTIPFKIGGNVYCVSDPDAKVTGIFEVAGVSEMRVFVDKPTEFPVFDQYCTTDTLGTANNPWSMVDAGTIMLEPTPGIFLGSTPICFICNYRGGTLERPAFWE